MTYLLAGGEELALGAGSARQTASKGRAAVLGSKLGHSSLKLGTEVADETLDGPGESLTKS